MKIALLTIHYANSYGGMLQAFASKVVLSQFGEVKILNYATKQLADTMHMVSTSGKRRSLFRTAKNLARFFPRRRLLNRFRSFQNTHLPQTDQLNTWEELQAQADRFDTFISGSDQIWNPKVTGSFDPAYFLGFVTGKRKVAFASSAGSYRYTPQERAHVRALLEDFSALGLREGDMKEYLTELLEREDIVTVLDPTLLLTADEWLDAFGLSKTTAATPYMLIYALKLNGAGRQMIRTVADQLGLRVVTIDQEPFLRYRADEHRNDIGPQEYLELFANASFVVTDSFHGTAFSLNFNIPFISIPPSSGINRISNLLKSVGLESRLASGQALPTPDVCFLAANRRLEELRAQSFGFLENSLRQ